MKYRIIPHCFHYQRCLCNPSDSGLKSEMKESKASERKKTHKSLIFHLLFYVPYLFPLRVLLELNMILSLLMTL